jgi:hypothetical protein
MPAPTDAASPTRNVSQVLWVANQPGETGLHVLQHEHPPCGFVLLVARARSQDLLAEPVGEALVLGLDLGKLDQELTHRRVPSRFRSAAVEAVGLVFHVLGELADLVEIERRHQPQRFLGDEALHILATDQRQIFAEFRPIELEQPGAMAHLLVRHLVEDFGGSRIFRAQAFGEAAIDAAVLVLAGDGEGDDFPFGELGKAPHETPHY